MPEIIDPEFGHITVRRLARSTNIRFSVATSGKLSISAPRYTPLFLVKQALNSSRGDVRKLLDNPRLPSAYQNGQSIGKSHKLAVVETGLVKKPETKTERDTLIVRLPASSTLEDTRVQQLIRDEVVKILRKEAKQVLPGRIAAIAKTHGFSYTKLRFSHSGGRWGSCSSNGTISLNIALMKLPDELIDYVLIHELCHTRHMNHSRQFWDEVGAIDPHFRLHKRQIARHTPTV